MGGGTVGRIRTALLAIPPMVLVVISDHGGKGSQFSSSRRCEGSIVCLLSGPDYVRAHVP